MGLPSTLSRFLGLSAVVAAAPIQFHVAHLGADATSVSRSGGDDSARRLRRSGTGTQIMSGTITDIDQNTEVRGPLWYGSSGKIGIAAKMLRDAHVRQSIEYIAGPLMAANWRFKPWSKSDLDREVADCCTWAFFEQLTWDQILRGIVQRYASNGFDLVEMTDDNRPIPADRFPLHPGKGFGIVPTGLHEIPASTIDRWNQSQGNPSQLAGIRQFLGGSDAEAAGFRDIPSDRFTRLTYDQDGANFAGFSVLRSAYGPWKLKQLFLTWDAIKHERGAVPTPSLELGEDATEDDVAAAQSILAEMRAHERGYIVLPSGYKFKWEGSGESNVTNIRLAIDSCNTDIAINVSAGFTRLGLTGPGSYALGSTQLGVYHLAVSGHAKFIAAALSVGSDGGESPVARFVRLNYGPGVQAPRAIAKNLPTRPAMEVAKVYFSGVQMGALTADDATEDEIRESLELCARDAATARKIPYLTTPTPQDSGEADQTPPDDIQQGNGTQSADEYNADAEQVAA